MRKFTVLAAILLTGCAATVPLASESDDAAAKVRVAPTDSALIYIVRKPQYYGKAILFRAEVDGQSIGGIGPGTYRVVTVTSGKHTVRVSGNENEESREIDAKAGEAYYVVIHARTGLMTARVGLDAPDTDGRAFVQGSKLAQ